MGVRGASFTRVGREMARGMGIDGKCEPVNIAPASPTTIGGPPTSSPPLESSGFTLGCSPPQHEGRAGVGVM